MVVPQLWTRRTGLVRKHLEEADPDHLLPDGEDIGRGAHECRGPVDVQRVVCQRDWTT